MRFKLGEGGSEPLELTPKQRILSLPPVLRENYTLDKVLKFSPEKRPVFEQGKLSPSQERLLDQMTHEIDPGRTVKISPALGGVRKLQYVLEQRASQVFDPVLWPKDRLKSFFQNLNAQPGFNDFWWRFYEMVRSQDRVIKDLEAYKDLRDVQKNDISSAVQRIELAKGVRVPETIGFLKLSASEVAFFEEEVHMSTNTLTKDQRAFLEKMTGVLKKKLPVRYRPKDFDQKEQPAKLQSILFPGSPKRADGFFWDKSWERLRMVLNYENFYESTGFDDLQKEFFRVKPRLMMGNLNLKHKNFLDDMTEKLRKWWPDAFYVIGRSQGSPIRFQDLKQPQKLQALLFRDKKKIDGDFWTSSWQRLEAALVKKYPFQKVPPRTVRLKNGVTTEEIRLRVAELEAKMKTASVRERERIRQQKIALQKLIEMDKATSVELSKIIDKGAQVDYVTYGENLFKKFDRFGFYTVLGTGVGRSNEQASGNYGGGVLYEWDFSDLSDLVPDNIRNLFKK